MSAEVWLFVLSLILLYSFVITLYRLFFHPLARFPGPRLAAATFWYEFYYDVVKRPTGTFIHHVSHMHDTYGPIVRINPDEIHIRDSAWASILYSGPGNGIRDKYPPAAKMHGTPQSVFGSVKHGTHRTRRAAISPFFSKKAVFSFESCIHNNVEILIAQLSEQSLNDGFAQAEVNFLAMTTDTVYEMAFQTPLGLLKSPRDAINWQRTIIGLTLLAPLVRQFNWLIPVALKLPLRFLNFIDPDLARVMALHLNMREKASESVNLHQRKMDETSSKFEKEISNSKNVFEGMLSSPVLSKCDKEPERMAQDGFLLIAAGGQTTAKVLTTATFFLIRNERSELSILLSELCSVMPDPKATPSLSELERLPYLTAVLKESLRITSIVTSRLPLVSPEDTLQYREHSIPPGTPVSMYLRDILLDPHIFENPLEFRPERWLASNVDIDRISQAYIPFGRGTRSCFGINLAMAQLYIVIGTLFRRFSMKLHDTVRERDVDTVRDCFLGMPSPDSTGVKLVLCDLVGEN